jgi:hypothetical protein
MDGKSWGQNNINSKTSDDNCRKEELVVHIEVDYEL